jgi:hypothetical protein
MEYTFGQTFATASPPGDVAAAAAGGSFGGSFGGSLDGTLSRSPAPGVAGATVTPTSPGGTANATAGATTGGQATGGGATPPTGASAPTTAATVQGSQLPELVRTSIDTLPIAVTTALAASVLPLGVVMLWAVVGSLARGLPALRFPPFRD